MNRASSEFSRIQVDAQSLSAKIKDLGLTLMGIGASTTAIASVAHEFGILNDEQMRVVQSVGAVVSGIGSFIMVLDALKTSSIAVAIAEHARAAAHALALAFTGPAGWAILAGCAVAAGAAMAYLATQTMKAADAQGVLNDSMGQMPGNSRSVQRAGDLEMARRGIVGSP